MSWMCSVAHFSNITVLFNVCRVSLGTTDWALRRICIWSLTGKSNGQIHLQLGRDSRLVNICRTKATEQQLKTMAQNECWNCSGSLFEAVSSPQPLKPIAFLNSRFPLDCCQGFCNVIHSRIKGGENNLKHWLIYLKLLSREASITLRN